MENINVENMTVKQIRQIQALLKGPKDGEAGHPYQVGQPYFIRTVTHYYTGKVEKVCAKELVLSSAAWIADTGRFHDALKTGKLNEVEPFPGGEVIIGRGAVIDATRWQHDLPLTQK
jgi:hypothetical protein